MYHAIVRNFAMELEAQGLWEHAVFVLLHLPGFAPESADNAMIPSDALDTYVIAVIAALASHIDVLLGHFLLFWRLRDP